MYTVDYSAIAAWASGHVEAALFYLLAFIAIPLAFSIMFDPRIIRCGFLLIGVFGAISGIFFLLQAQFLALAQLMIYAVGITLVVVIALMLTNPRLEIEAAPVSQQNKVFAGIISVVLFATIYLALRAETWTARTNMVCSPDDNIVHLGTLLLTYYSMPFEFASVLLLVALVGAIMLAKQDPPSPPEQLSEDVLEAEENVVKV